MTTVEVPFSSGPALGGFGECRGPVVAGSAALGCLRGRGGAVARGERGIRALGPTPACPPPRRADPFADAAGGESGGGKKDSKEYVHIRVQQRNGKKCLTTVQGLDTSFDYKKILKALKKGERAR